jgi:hypothetical protein
MSGPTLGTVVTGATSGQIQVQIYGQVGATACSALAGPVYTAGQTVLVVFPFGATIPWVVGIQQ